MRSFFRIALVAKGSLSHLRASTAPNPEYGRTYRCTNVSFLEETHARAIGKLSFGAGPSWPSLDRGTINVKSLHQPSAYVISLSEAAPRRKVFADQWRHLDFDVPISWVSATNARDIDAVTVEPGFFEPRQNYFANFQSHAEILKYEAGRGRDILVFEDDVRFHPNFTRRLSRVLETLPDTWDLLKLGGQWWDPPFEEGQGWVKVRGVSRNWGYVVRAAAVQKVLGVVRRAKDHGAYDAILAAAAFACDQQHRIDTYVPDAPLVCELPDQFSADEKSDKGHDYTRDEKGMTPASLAAIHFPTTYDKTFCHYPTDHISGWLDYCCEHQDTVAGQLKYCPSSTFSQAIPH